MTQTYNTNPYYDDFEKTKNYVKILFKPGLAVQARELTQIQTAIQEQIKAIGGFLFKNESLVSGGQATIYRVNWINVVSADLTDYVGKFIVGATSGAKAKIVSIKNTISPGIGRIYFSYKNGFKFDKAETINEDEFSPTVASVVTTNETLYTGVAVAYSLAQSVFFVKEYFVVSPEQTVILGDTINPTTKVGLQVFEEILTYQDDETLLDPSTGSFNYAAPGADRVSISLTLGVYPYDPITGAAADVIEDSEDDFIEIARFVDGVRIKQLTNPSLGGLEDVFARRTYDESGDYTVRSFSATAKENVNKNTELLSVAIGPGKAYVKGYEFETTSTLNLDLEKARETRFVENFIGSASFGDYFIVNHTVSFASTLNYTDNLAVTFTGATGSARVRYVERIDSTKLKVYVYDLQLTAGAIKDITELINGSWVADVDGTNPDKLYRGKTPSHIIPLINSPIQELSDISYVSQVMVSLTATTTTLTHTTGVSGKTYPSATATDYVVVKTSDGTFNTGFTVSTSGGQTFTLTGTFTNGATYQVFAKLAVSTPTVKTKTRTNNTVYLTNSSANTITLGVADCYRIVSIIANHSTNVVTPLDVTGRYDLRTGQKDAFYDYGFIKLKKNQDAARVATYDRLQVTLEYFEESQEAGFFTVDSYDTLSANTSLIVPYKDIPSFTSSTGVTVSLRDVIDFRARRAKIASWPGTLGSPIGSSPNNTIDGNEFIQPLSTITCDYSFYLPRVDKLILTKEKKFDLIRGIPSETPQVPSDLPDAMSLYTINVPAYTFSPAEVKFNYIENRRYTMRDIGKMDKRLGRLEYYTSMSLLEKQASDETIFNSTGVEKFKNGILVDPFAGHGVGDIGHAEYSCSIDSLTRTLRPKFGTESVTFDVNVSTTPSDSYSKNDDLLMLPFSTSNYVENVQATNWVNLNPYLVFDWIGEISLNPATDVWSDKETRPDVVVNINGDNDAFTSLVNDVTNPASVGVKWADWQLVDKGIVVTSTSSSSDSIDYALIGGKAIQTTQTTTNVTNTTTVNETLNRTGLEFEKSAISTITTDLGSKVVDASIIPFIRSRIIDFTAKKMKPNTVLFASFDGVDVSKECIQAAVIFAAAPARAKKVRKVGTSKTADILMIRSDRAFIKMYINESLFQIGEVLEWEVDNSWVASGSVSSVVAPDSTSLTTDERGDIAGYFLIPNSPALRFRTGIKAFKLSDSLGKQPTTAAETKYVAEGLSMSLEKTVVATRVQTVAINPLTDTTEQSTSTSSVNTSINTSTKDVTVICGETQSGSGTTGKFTYNLDFGTDVGSCGINYDPTGIPDRYTIIWNGRTISTGFRGDKGANGVYDTQLNSMGYPGVTTLIDANNTAAGKLRFEKKSIFPKTAKLIVDAPLSGTTWAWKAICPGKTDNLLPETAAAIKLTVDSPVMVTLAAGAGSTAYNFTVKIDGTSNVPVGTPVKITSIARTESLTNGSYSAFESGSRITVNGVSATFPITTATGRTLTFGVSFNTTATAIASGVNSYGALRSPISTITVNGELVTAIDGSVAATSGSDQTSFSQSAPVVVSIWEGGNNDGRGADPVAQTFTVSGTTNRDGIFVDSVDIFFKKKPTSDNVAVTVQLRPVVNGYPSSTEIMPFGTAIMFSKDITTSLEATVNKVGTNFKFQAPVYLSPNTEYAVVVVTNSDQFEIYTTRLGEFLISNANSRVTKQPLMGSLFLSQNGGTWTAEQFDDMLIRVKKCIFPVNTPKTLFLMANIPEKLKTSNRFDYDTFFMDGEVLDFANTNVDYAFKTSKLNGTTYTKDSSWNLYQLGSNVALSERKSISFTDPTTLRTRCILTTSNSDISPVIDLSRLSTVMIQNIINDNKNSETAQTTATITSVAATTGVVTITTSPAHGYSALDFVEVYPDEDNVVGGYVQIATVPDSTHFTYTRFDGGAAITENAQSGTVIRKAQAYSRYITRKVTLNPDFYSSDIKTYFYGNIPSGCSITPYYRVTNLTDTSIDDNPWVEMRLESVGAVGSNGFAEYKYKAAYDITNDTYALANGDTFGSFAVKLVLLSSNPVKVPLVKELRVLALDD